MHTHTMNACVRSRAIIEHAQADSNHTHTHQLKRLNEEEPVNKNVTHIKCKPDDRLSSVCFYFAFSCMPLKHISASSSSIFFFLVFKLSKNSMNRTLLRACTYANEKKSSSQDDQKQQWKSDHSLSGWVENEWDHATS